MQYLIPLTLLLAPAYVIKINIFGLPGNVLMLWIFLLWIIFAGYLYFTKQGTQFFMAIKNCDKKILYFIALFFIGGIISLLVSGINNKTLGEFLVLFLQPISIYFIGKFLFTKFPNTKHYILNTIYFLLAVAGLYAAVQYFTGLGLPLLFRGNDFEPRRAVSFFIHSNFYALWAAPLLAFLIPDAVKKIRDWKLEIGNWKFVIAWIIGALGLLLSLSRAGWIGLAAAIVAYALFAGDKKIKQTLAWLCIIIVIAISLIPGLQNRLTTPFRGEKSASSRITLWQSGITAIKQSPVFGLGLGGYSSEYRKLITDQTLPDHNFPHNIFLNFWVETGVIGLIGMIGLIGIFIYKGLSDKKNLFKLSVSLFLIAILTQGQIDNPYFKNDLAIVFWIILSVF